MHAFSHSKLKFAGVKPVLDRTGVGIIYTKLIYFRHLLKNIWYVDKRNITIKFVVTYRNTSSRLFRV